MLRKTRSDSGQAILEFAVILPVFILVGFGLADVVWALEKVSSLEYIVTEVARCESLNAVVCTSPPNNPRRYANRLADNVKMDTSRLDMLPPLTCDTATQTTCDVTMTYQFQPLGVWFPVRTITRVGTASVPLSTGGHGGGGDGG